MRVHQWVKNLLVLAPALAAHQFGQALAASLIAFVSFSLCASSLYILNDLLDRESDRAHPRKKLRPFAAGNLSSTTGLWFAFVLFAGAVAIALTLPLAFPLVLVGYATVGLLYSVWLKSKLLVDVVVLACLYGIRLQAGGAASELALSPWLVAFSIFLFFCLATIKRCAELADHKASGGTTLPGRGYSTLDLQALISLSAASGLVSVLVLALYVDSDAVHSLYSHPDRLWFACVPYLFWISRMILLTHRGEMHDDPIVFAFNDATSIAVAIVCALIVLAAV
jgi:4-hydroxybenzoate polyprenyltransferase